jgi:hypothetical protein
VECLVSLEELKHQATQLPASERIELLSAVIQSLQGAPQAENWQFLVSRLTPGASSFPLKGANFWLQPSIET